MADIEQSLQDIQQERSRLLTAKANLKTAINGKGGNITDDKLDSYYVYVNEIDTGSDVSGVTATPADVRKTVKYVTASGELISGTMPDSTASVADGKVTVTAGYLSADYVYTVPAVEGTDLSFVTAGAGQILSGYIGSDRDGNPVNGDIATRSKNDIGFIAGTIDLIAGYYPAQNVEIPSGEITLSGNVVTVKSGWVSDNTFEVEPDTSDATVTTTDLVMGVTAYGANGKIYGERQYAEDGTVYFSNGKLCTINPVYLDPNNPIPMYTFDGTAQPEDLAYGKTAYVGGGMIIGGMSHLTVGNMVIMENAVLSIPQKSYVDFGESYSLLNIAGIGDLSAENIVEGKTIAGIPGSHKCATTEVVAGVLVDDGGTMKVQKLSFDGTTPSDDGDPVTVDSFYTFNTGRDEPVYDSGISGGSTMEIYKCAEVKSPVSILIVSNANNGPGYNGTYVLDSGTGNSRIWRDQTDSTHVVMYNSGYGKWCIGTLPEGYTDSAYLSAHHVANETDPVDPWDCSYTGGAVIVSNTDASWSGYLYNTETKEFADTLTEGLEYKMAAPIVGKCYNADATMLIDLYAPTGLIFYAPLHEEKTTDELGNTLNYNGTQTFVTENGVPCMYCNSTYVYANSSNIPSSNATRTLSCMVKLHTINNNDVAWILYMGKDSYYMRFVSGRGSSDLVCELSNGNWLGGGSFTSDISSWAHVSAVYENRVTTMYLNGVYITSFSITSDLNTESTIGIGTVQGNTSRYFNGYISEVKVWNRVLSADEIKAEADRCLAMVEPDSGVVGAKLTVTSSNTSTFAGTYIINDATATGTSRVWSQDGNTAGNTIAYVDGAWYLCVSGIKATSISTGENPWDSVVSPWTVTVAE